MSGTIGEHTPGPWKAVVYERPCRIFMPHDLREVQDARGSHVASLFVVNRPEQVEAANAALIAAAPDLLAALIGCRQALVDAYADDPTFTSIIGPVDAAISKARSLGGQNG